jgi:hypothetical protein
MYVLVKEEMCCRSAANIYINFSYDSSIFFVQNHRSPKIREIGAKKAMSTHPYTDAAIIAARSFRLSGRSSFQAVTAIQAFSVLRLSRHSRSNNEHISGAANSLQHNL